MYDDIFESIRYEAEKRNLRESTINLYCANVNYFLRCIGKTASELTLDDAESFLSAKRLEGRSPETHSHLKHKAIIATMYSSGLRVSEAVHLHYDDISRTNMTIHVRETKGRIDRYTILSRKNLDLLSEYWYKCGRPRGILFPSSWTGGYLDITSVNQFFKKSARLAGITRRVSSHACRHSFSSHLFESGTDIKYIQSLLGHVDPRSTDVYLHVSNKTLLGIRSPFDGPQGGEE
ncbi:tyrosine-type recombinase/integrase [Enterocloster clostridioformis]